VFLQGCVRTRAQIALAVAIARAVPGVEHVGDELMVGTRGRPPYETAPR
jgi:osmotically-inducible protein OsmY